MKTPCPASRVLSSLVLIWGIASTAPLSAQVYSVPPPPPGYGTTPARQPTARATRQSAAAIQTPVTHPQSAGTYPPPPGYTYPPPGYSTPKSTVKKPGPPPQSTLKKGVVKKPQAGPPPPPKAASHSGDLNRQVSTIRENDKAQNQRIGALERDVSNIQHRGSGDAPARSVPYNGGSDFAAHTTYISRPGDTLWRIAAMHRVSVGEIQQLNRMTEDEVRVGQTLLIPSPHNISAPSPSYTQVSYTPTGATAPRVSAPPTTMVKTSAPVYYTVKKGDSLKAIALKHKMAPTTLASANKIKDPNKIVVGQRLKIPGRTTTVMVPSKAKPEPQREFSDTIPLPGYGVQPPPSSGLSQPPPAASLAPPPAPMSPTPAPAPAPRSPDTSDSHRGILAYRVDRTDTIESIATQFTTTPDQIRDMNRLSPGSALKAGDEIMVPAMGAVSVNSR